MVQELRKTVRRFDTSGEGSMLTGKLYCADCGGKMHYRRGTTRAGRDWRGIPNGKSNTHPQALTVGHITVPESRTERCAVPTPSKEDTVKQLIA